MSALPPKADIRCRDRHVRFVPKADICTAAIHLSQLSRLQATEICDPVRGGMREFHQLLVVAGPLFIPPALRERNIRLREFVSYGEDSVFHCGAITL